MTIGRKTENKKQYIFRRVHNINLKTVIGYHKGNMNYNFLDDYDGESKARQDVEDK